MQKRKKRSKTAILHSKMLRLVSEYIKLRDSDKNGMAFCCSCGKEMKAFKNKACHAGHFYCKKRFAGIKYIPMNINIQCNFCNLGSSFSPYAYTKYMINKYGVETLDWLETESKKPYEGDTVKSLEAWVFVYQVLIDLEKLKKGI